MAEPWVARGATSHSSRDNQYYNTSVAEHLIAPVLSPDSAVSVRPAYPRDAALLYRWRSEPPEDVILA